MFSELFPKLIGNNCRQGMEWEVGKDLAAGQSQGCLREEAGSCSKDAGVSVRGSLVPRPPEQLSGGGGCMRGGAGLLI